MDEPEADDVDDDDDSVYGDSRSASRFGYAESSSTQDANAAPRETGLERQAGQRFQGAHGEMEWGETPKKSFVLFGVDDED